MLTKLLNVLFILTVPFCMVLGFLSPYPSSLFFLFVGLLFWIKQDLREVQQALKTIELKIGLLDVQNQIDEEKDLNE